MLREYQLSDIADLHKSFVNKENTLIQLPTGKGKTTVIARYLREWRNQNQNKRALVVAHRAELIDQIVKKYFNLEFFL